MDASGNTAGYLSSEQAAGRLGIKAASLYAYVSRGLIRRARIENGQSWFDPLDVEAFAAARTRLRTPTKHGKPLMVLDWPLTEVTATGLRYRGVRADLLAATVQFEEAIEFFWDSGVAPEKVAAQFRAGALAAQRIDRLLAAADGRLDPLGRMALSLMVDAQEATAAPFATGRCIIAGFLRSVSPPDGAWEPDAPIARRLWQAFSDRPASKQGDGLVNAALVLSIDHDLALSTFAARVAASSGASAARSMSAALGAFGGPLHGAASIEARRLLVSAMDGPVERALSAHLARTGSLTAFGHPIYTGTDPRAAMLLGLLESMPGTEALTVTLRQLIGIVHERLGLGPNLDLALAALTYATGMPPEAGPVIFAIGRSVGWFAHIRDEGEHEPLRLRPQSRFTG